MNFIDFKLKNIQSTLAILSYFDELLIEAKATLGNAKDTDLENGTWSMRYGDIVYFTLPKKQVLRTFCMNHLVHHRAQLGIYLRLLDIPVPAVYRPSAADDNVLLVQPFAI